MIEKLFPATILALFCALSSGVLAGQQGSTGSPTGPDDDLGTLPSTNGGAKPPSSNDDDLGTLPSSKGDDSRPTITFSGPMTSVTGLLTGVSGNGGISYGPGPEPGTVTAYLTGDLTIPILSGDPRLALVQIELRTGDLPSLGEVSASGVSSGAFYLAPGTRVGLPVHALFAQQQLSELRRIRFDLLTAEGAVYGLGVHTHGAFLILDQHTR